MQIQCDYCKNWIEDTEEQCPFCGAVNANLRRYTGSAPKTIEELRQWYKDRNLPDENITRFFIGKDYRGAKAFGVYQDGKNFITYKNKADGSRSVRYKGPDEAYAVNELYLKLKEEVLRQKARNIAAGHPAGINGNIPGAEISRSSMRSSGSASGDQTEEERRKAEFEDAMRVSRAWSDNAARAKQIRREEKNRKRKKKRRIQGWLYAIFFALLFIGTIALYESDKIKESYYAVSADPVYYRSGHKNEWEWWKFTDDEWQWLASREKDDFLPDGITKKDAYDSREKLEEALSIKVPDIKQSHAYLDMHPKKPDGAYYYSDDILWYYAVDNYGSSYGNNRSGWYYYDEDDEDWQYYAGYYEKDRVPEELYYDGDEHLLTNSYSQLQTDYAYMFPADFVWSESSDFSTTDYYADIERSRERHLEEERRREAEDDDDDFDWDDDSSWDSDSYDWDSDW